MKRRRVTAGSSPLREAKRVFFDPLIFHSKVNAAGYQWANGLLDGEPRLVPRAGVEEESSGPLNLGDVLIKFATLTPAPDDIRSFADEFGVLYPNERLEDHAAHDGVTSGGITLRDWQNEIGNMRVLFDLWESIKKCKHKRLKEVIRWEAKGRCTSVSYQLDAPT